MKTIKIKTFNLKTPDQTNQFYLLSKGYNAGKPLEKPCPNCFVVTADDIKHKHQLFWICYGLWKSGKFLPLLCGSVIPFLHIRDASTEIEKALKIANGNPKEFEKNVDTLKVLIKTEKLIESQLNMIKMIKIAIAKNFASD